MTGRLKPDAQAVRVGGVTKEALIRASQEITRARGSQAYLSELVDALVAEHLPGLTARLVAEALSGQLGGTCGVGAGEGGQAAGRPEKSGQ